MKLSVNISPYSLSALPAPHTHGCTHAQRVLHGVYTLGVLLLKAPTLHVKTAAQPVLARPPASATRPPARASPPRWSPLLAQGSASREEKRHPSVLGGKLPGSSERKPFTTTLGGPNNILLSRSTRVYPTCTVQTCVVQGSTVFLFYFVRFLSLNV